LSIAPEVQEVERCPDQEPDDDDVEQPALFPSASRSAIAPRTRCDLGHVAAKLRVPSGHILLEQVGVLLSEPPSSTGLLLLSLPRLAISSLLLPELLTLLVIRHRAALPGEVIFVNSLSSSLPPPGIRHNFRSGAREAMNRAGV